MLLPASHHTVANPRRHCVRNVNKRPDVTGMVWNTSTLKSAAEICKLYQTCMFLSSRTFAISDRIQLGHHTR